MKKNTDCTIIALCIPLFIAILFNLPACNKNEEKQPATTGKYIIDLPEEINQSTGNDLEAYKQNDTIFIQFKKQ